MNKIVLKEIRLKCKYDACHEVLWSRTRSVQLILFCQRILQIGINLVLIKVDQFDFDLKCKYDAMKHFRIFGCLGAQCEKASSIMSLTKPYDMRHKIRINTGEEFLNSDYPFLFFLHTNRLNTHETPYTLHNTIITRNNQEQYGKRWITQNLLECPHHIVAFILWNIN